MHHFIFPSQDTYITNRPNDLNVQNFGVDEILQVGTQNTLLGYISDTTDYTYVNTPFNHVGVTFFNGQFTGSVTGTDVSSSAYLTPLVGPLTHSLGLFTVNDFTGSIASGSIICLFGTASGVDVRAERSRQYMTQSNSDRALLKFDITAISQSIATGSIINPSFHLKVKICNEYQLPIEYTIYIAPISQSWVMGDGYASDGGSQSGASWVYRDYYGGTPWSASGATWFQTYATQSFRYKSADLDVDVTPLVNMWLTGQIPNEGFIVLSSDEFHPTGSGFLLRYFSEDTNTIYSPVLDAAWDDSEFVTGSIFTGSNATQTQVTASNTTVQLGSSLWGAGGIHGNFTAFAYLTTQPHYVTSSGFLFTGSYVQTFTGSFTGSVQGVIYNVTGTYSGSGEFVADYFTGSIDGAPIETSGSISSSYIDGFVSGTVAFPTLEGGFTGEFTSPALNLLGGATGSWLDEMSDFFIAYLSGSGFTGNINGYPVFGPTEGLISINQYTVNLPNEIKYLYPTSPMEAPYASAGINNMFPITNNPYTYLNLEWVWGGDGVGWTSLIPLPGLTNISTSCGVSHSVQMMTGSFTGGPYVGCSFSAYYENYKIIFATLTGSWTDALLNGASVYIPLPQTTYPYVTALVSGPYIYGNAFGLYQQYISTSYSASITSSVTSSVSASFSGEFVNGPLMGAHCVFQLGGNAFTSSFSYWNSGSITSSVLNPLDTGRQFSINLTNLQAEYKAGDLIKLNVFGRKKFPLKYFGISTQQEQYLVPEFLPATSYYALKDNQTDEIVVNFDSYTRISCAYPEGNYFIVDSTGLPQERFYRVLIRVEDGTIVDTIDTGKIFKITR